MATIPKNVVSELIELGRSGLPGIPPSLADQEAAWQKLMCGHEPWERLAGALDNGSLRDLICGLVLYSQASGWSGGSVSPVIQLYQTAIQRDPEREAELSAWIVRERRNGFEPFGTTNHGGARTQEEFAAHRRSIAARPRRPAQDLGAIRAARRLREAEEATERLANAVRRGDVGAVTAMLDKGANWRAVVADRGSLVALAQANGRDAVAALLLARGVS